MTESTAAVEGSGEHGTVLIEGKNYPVEVVDGRRQAKLENGNVAVLSSERESPKKRTKMELKRLQQYQERRRRLINKGVHEDKVDAVIAEEDYHALPIEKKFEQLFTSVRTAITGFASDLNELRHNDGVISDVIDVNARAFAKCLTKAGISLEVQGEIFKEAEAEIRAELQKRLEDQNENQRRLAKQQAELAEKVTLDSLKKAEGKAVEPVQTPANPDPIPEGATTFGD